MLVFCLTASASSGCAVQQLKADQDKIRTALLDLYTDQIMDNLIRLSKGWPIIQLDYTNATALVTVADTTSLSDSVASTASRVTTGSLTGTLTNGQTTGITQTMSATPSTVTAATTALTGVLASAWSAVSTHGVLNTVTGGATHSNSNQVAITAMPVTQDNSVYDAYLYFLSLKDKEGNIGLRITCEPPEDGTAIICRKVGKTYYWIPISFKEQFILLSLATTAQRGKVVVFDDYVTRVMKAVNKGESDRPDQKGKNYYNFEFVLEKAIPNKAGTILFDGQTIDYGPVNPKTGPSPPQIDTIRVTIKLADPSIAKEVKKGQGNLGATMPENLVLTIAANPEKVSINIPGWPSYVPSTPELINRVNLNLQQIQLQLNQQSH
jgi:hypothetical protein